MAPRPPLLVFEVGQAEPGSSTVLVGADRPVEGVLGAIEVGGLVFEPGLGLLDGRLRLPVWADRPYEGAEQGGPDRGEGERGQAAADLSEAAAGAIFAQVQPQGDQQPEPERHRRHPDPAGRQQVDRHRQCAGPQGGSRDQNPPPEERAEQDGPDPGRADDHPADEETGVIDPNILIADQEHNQ